MSLIIVSGLSGSGKTIALQALEDLGIYCIDNLPASLLPHFAEQLRAAERNGVRQAAVGIDARNRAFLDALPDSLARLRTLGMPTRTIFLEADEAALIKRFKETRRRHPLTDPNTPLMESIQLERKLLEPLAFNPAIRIDTTHTTPHELRSRVQDFARGDEAGGMTLLFESFGFKSPASRTSAAAPSASRPSTSRTRRTSRASRRSSCGQGRPTGRRRSTG